MFFSFNKGIINISANETFLYFSSRSSSLSPSFWHVPSCCFLRFVQWLESCLGFKEIEDKTDSEIAALSSTLFPVSFSKLAWYRSEELSSFPFTVFRLILVKRFLSELIEVKFVTSGNLSGHSPSISLYFRLLL